MIGVTKCEICQKYKLVCKKKCVNRILRNCSNKSMYKIEIVLLYGIPLKFNVTKVADPLKKTI